MINSFFIENIQYIFELLLFLYRICVITAKKFHCGYKLSIQCDRSYMQIGI
jgi:hypothetical protein